MKYFHKMEGEEGEVFTGLNYVVSGPSPRTRKMLYFVVEGCGWFNRTYLILELPRLPWIKVGKHESRDSVVELHGKR